MTHLESCPDGERIEALYARMARRRLDVVLIFNEANIRALTGVTCDNGCLVLSRDAAPFFITDFRYVPMLHRLAPWLETVQLKRGQTFAAAVKRRLARSVARLGYEGNVTAVRWLALKKAFPEAVLVDVADEVLMLRAVKTLPETAALVRAIALNDEIWSLARKEIRPGMTEREIQRVIRGFMAMLGDGEAFETIVCAGANAAECHHVPDETRWEKGMPLLVDMGVKLDGVCSDMTRCLPPTGRGAAQQEYRRIYELVKRANEAAIAAARPGLSCGDLDKVARDVIAEAGYGEAFGHALGHGVGYEIHEEPSLRTGSSVVLEPGMFVTIEPGVYLEGRLGIRIEDLVMITPDGCRVLTRSRK